MPQPNGDQIEHRQGRRGSPNGAEHAPRRRYARPDLRAYGTLVEITLFGGSQLLDSGANLQNP